MALLFVYLAMTYNYRKQNSPEVLREKQTVKETNSFDDKINSLKELKDKEILTAQEYNDKVKNLENQKQDSELKSSEDYKKLTKMIVEFANKNCKGRLVSILEGGYNLNALNESVKFHINALIV